MANRILVLETVDELNWMFYSEEHPDLFCFQFKARGFDNARTRSKLMYWMWCLLTGEIEKNCSPSDFLKQRPELE